MLLILYISNLERTVLSEQWVDCGFCQAHGQKLIVDVFIWEALEVDYLLPETNSKSTPENRPVSAKGKDRLPTIKSSGEHSGATVDGRNPAPVDR